MKIRKCFVSNSSSSSFVIAIQDRDSIKVSCNLREIESKYIDNLYSIGFNPDDKGNFNIDLFKEGYVFNFGYTKKECINILNDIESMKLEDKNRIDYPFSLECINFCNHIPKSLDSIKYDDLGLLIKLYKYFDYYNSRDKVFYNTLYNLAYLYLKYAFDITKMIEGKYNNFLEYYKMYKKLEKDRGVEYKVYNYIDEFNNIIDKQRYIEGLYLNNIMYPNEQIEWDIKNEISLFIILELYCYYTRKKLVNVILNYNDAVSNKVDEILQVLMDLRGDSFLSEYDIVTFPI